MLLAHAGCSTAPPHPAGHSNPADLGRDIAGTWLGQYRLEDRDRPSIALISTYHPDGTGLATSERTFGAGDPKRLGLSSTHHLQWEPSGEREIRWRLLHFLYDADGALTHLSRTHGITAFDERFEVSHGTFRVEIFEPGTLLDPLDPNHPDARPVFEGNGTVAAKRLHVRISGGPEAAR